MAREIEVERRKKRLRNMTCIFWGVSALKLPLLRAARRVGTHRSRLEPGFWESG
jgi:hypothetical protein